MADGQAYKESAYPGNLTNPRPVLVEDGVWESHSEELVSEEFREVFAWVVSTAARGILSLVGLGANGVNVAVFYSMGFKDTANISLLSLAVSDICSLLTLLWSSLWLNSTLTRLIPTVGNEFTFLTSGWPHILFIRISGWIIAFIAFERFLCIALPHKVNSILSPKVVKVFNCLVFFIVFASAMPIYYFNRLVWTFVPQENRSMLRLITLEGNEPAETILIFLNNVMSVFISFLAVGVFSSAIIYLLKRKSRLRLETNSKVDSPHERASLTQRDKKLARMMVVVSVVFIVCLTPTVTSVCLVLFMPGFRMNQEHNNLYAICFAISFMMEAINSSMNIIVYYKMSSRFKERLDRMIGRNSA